MTMNDGNQLSNKARKSGQKAAYHSQFKPHQRPRSRPWQKGIVHDIKFKRG